MENKEKNERKQEAGVPGDFVHHSKKNEEELNKLIHELGIKHISVFPNPCKMVSHDQCVEHLLQILQDYKKEKEGGTFGVPGKSNFRILNDF